MNRAQRKKQLLVQGAVYRAEALHARLALQEGLQPGPLLQKTAGAAWSLYRQRAAVRLLGGGLSGLLPLLGSAAGMFAGRGGRLKRGLRGALLAAGLAIGIRTLLRKPPEQAGSTQAENASDAG